MKTICVLRHQIWSVLTLFGAAVYLLVQVLYLRLDLLRLHLINLLQNIQVLCL